MLQGFSLNLHTLSQIRFSRNMNAFSSSLGSARLARSAGLTDNAGCGGRERRILARASSCVKGSSGSERLSSDKSAGNGG